MDAGQSGGGHCLIQNSCILVLSHFHAETVIYHALVLKLSCSFVFLLKLLCLQARTLVLPCPLTGIILSVPKVACSHAQTPVSHPQPIGNTFQPVKVHGSTIFESTIIFAVQAFVLQNPNIYLQHFIRCRFT